MGCFVKHYFWFFQGFSWTETAAGDCRVASLLAMTWWSQYGITIGIRAGIQGGREGHDPPLPGFRAKKNGAAGAAPFEYIA